MASNPKYLTDVQAFLDSVPYGEVSVSFIRVNRHTTKTETKSTETLRYTDNDEALRDIVGFLGGLIDGTHTGDVQFQIDFQSGQISLLAIKTTKETKYGENRQRPKSSQE